MCRSLQKLLSDIFLCMVDVVGFYPNMQHKESLSALRKRLDNRKIKYISSVKQLSCVSLKCH